MAEFAACAAVLGLLLLGTATISSYQEVQRRSVIAAREAAFEGAWLAGRAGSRPLQDQLAQQHFSDPGLTDPTGQAAVVDPEAVRLTGSDTQLSGQAAIATRLLLTPLRTAGGFLGGDFDLDERGMRAGLVSTDIVGADHLPAPFRDLQLRFDQRYALLADAWNAGSPQHVARRAGGLVPGRTLSSMSSIWRGLLAPVSLLEPSLQRLCLGVIEPDRIPEDRLDEGVATGVTC
jgi:hypothetical protein